MQIPDPLQKQSGPHNIQQNSTSGGEGTVFGASRTLSHSESVVRLSWPSIASALILMRKLSLSKRPGVQVQVAAYMSIGLIVGYRCVCELWGYYAAPRLYGIYGFRAEKLQGQGQRFRQILRVTLAAWFVVQQDGEILSKRGETTICELLSVLFCRRVLEFSMVRAKIARICRLAALPEKPKPKPIQPEINLDRTS